MIDALESLTSGTHEVKSSALTEYFEGDLLFLLENCCYAATLKLSAGCFAENSLF